MTIDRHVNPDLIARFSADCDALWPLDDRLALAVSGGPDSLALLLLANTARPGMVWAATVDHGLRPESAEEANQVADICSGLGVPHQILKVDLEPGNLQAQARLARYGALDQWMKREGLVLLATAHHADDQAETLLMRLNRGSGVAGLAGVRREVEIANCSFRLLRPLLGWRKQELIEIVQSAGIDAAQDPTNLDDEFDRVRIRKAIEGADWLNIEGFAQSAQNLSQAAEALEWATDREWRSRVSKVEGGLLYRPQAPRAIRLAILRKAIALLGSEPRGGAAARLLDALEQGEGGNVAGVLVRLQDGGWMLRREPPRCQNI